MVIYNKIMSQWDSYYKKLADKPPRPLLVRALSYGEDFQYKDALDIGAGTLNDSVHLLEEGWNVTAIDSSKEFLEYANAISHTKFKAINVPIEKYEFDKTFNLVNAQFVLPFINKTIFKDVFPKIVSLLDTGGIFCGQFFGMKDEWNTTSTQMTFLTEEEIRLFLNGFKVISLKEVEEDKETAAGNMKHWHVYHFIAIKN